MRIAAPTVKRITHRLATALLLATALAQTSCGSGGYDPSTTTGKKAILDEVRILLSDQNCSSAIELIKPVYNSKYTDNDVRMAMASTYGCSATINLFSLLGDVVTNSATFAAGGLWSFLATKFPSTTSDRIPEAGQLAQDALQAVISPSAVVLSNNLFNSTSFNPGAYAESDRLATANAYMFFTSMATIGGLESRYGNPLPWTDATLVTDDGCAYASAVVNFADSLTSLEAQTSGKFNTAVAAMKTAIQTMVYGACDYGCTILCGLPSCSTCPLALRDRTSCTQVATDEASCAAAGIVAMPVAGVNAQWGLFP